MFVESSDWGEETSTVSLLHSALFPGKASAQTSKKKLRRTRSSREDKHDEITAKSPKDLTKPQKVCSSGTKIHPACKLLPKKKSKLQAKMESRMEGARFRWINEQLYTTTGKQAKKMFHKDPELFQLYHDGFTTQVSKWPVNPLNRVISYVKALPTETIVADFGCGEAKLAQSVLHQVLSFDLVASSSQVIACDMANVPLRDRSVGVCVFCLSLMGTNVSDFIKEARRVLIKNGKLKICEIVSRMPSIEEFVDGVESLGFKLVSQEVFSTMFVDLEFERIDKIVGQKTSIVLKPCIYKKR